ncbi:MAG: CoA transferase [Deltaproteobacteria bacterium]|nr:CoA transferase [Deltaproteobacteria bacterium]
MNQKAVPAFRPLAGVRVLTVAESYPGPYATLLLADLGADVVMVERPGRGDPSRREPGMFRALARNKRSITADVKAPDEYARLLSLIDRCDVFIEGWRPGVAKRNGLDYATLSARNPRLVFVSISAFGQTGPYRLRPAHDLSLQALTGMLTNREETVTDEPYVPWGDLQAGTFAALGVVTALFRRERTGFGSEVDVSMADCLTSAMSVALAPLLNGDRPLHLTQPGYCSYRCADGGWINLSITHEDHLWEHLMEVLELPSLAGLDTPSRSERCEEIKAALAQRFATRTRADWEALLVRCDAAWAPVLALEEVLRDPQLRAREMFVPIEGQGRCDWAVAQPLKFDGRSLGPTRPAPALGDQDPTQLWED